MKTLLVSLFFLTTTASASGLFLHKNFEIKDCYAAKGIGQIQVACLGELVTPQKKRFAIELFVMKQNGQPDLSIAPNPMLYAHRSWDYQEATSFVTDPENDESLVLEFIDGNGEIVEEGRGQITYIDFKWGQINGEFGIPYLDQFFMAPIETFGKTEDPFAGSR